MLSLFSSQFSSSLPHLTFYKPVRNRYLFEPLALTITPDPHWTKSLAYAWFIAEQHIYLSEPSSNTNKLHTQTPISIREWHNCPSTQMTHLQTKTNMNLLSKCISILYMRVRKRIRNHSDCSKLDQTELTILMGISPILGSEHRPIHPD